MERSNNTKSDIIADASNDDLTPPETTLTIKVADLVAQKPDYTKTTNTEAEDAYGNKIVIPAGFCIVPESPEGTDDSIKVVYSYAGEDGPVVQDGIVIQDRVGNQFVWVPIGTINNKPGDTEHGVTTKIELGRYNFDLRRMGRYKEILDRNRNIRIKASSIYR